ncbi:LOG family protein [Candidatus Laterigemmans baculatus]|uniref:LOG family protein n=1 Tax=Candidatus Laterigemmans baculatus TaxID=2770505 RepID=UPI0013D976EA|nr:LOG family protein [Candidatus Laterigemmans baculatus]
MSTESIPWEKPGTISLADEEAVKEVLVSSVLGLWEVVNNLTRLRPSKRERYRVTIFGSARAQPGSYVYGEVKRVAEALSEMGCDIITGGGPGLMQAANEGAAAAGAPQRDHSVGIRVHLPFEQHVNPFVEQAFEHRTFFTRLHHFVLASDAFVVAPGGIGTVLELTMVWQLLQVRHIHDAPLILVGKMWDELVEWARRSLLREDVPLANPEDIEIPRCVPTADQAIALLREHHAIWKSEREQQTGQVGSL